MAAGVPVAARVARPELELELEPARVPQARRVAPGERRVAA